MYKIYQFTFDAVKLKVITVNKKQSHRAKKEYKEHRQIYTQNTETAGAIKQLYSTGTFALNYQLAKFITEAKSAECPFHSRKVAITLMGKDTSCFWNYCFGGFSNPDD